MPSPKKSGLGRGLAELLGEGGSRLSDLRGPRAAQEAEGDGGSVGSAPVARAAVDVQAPPGVLDLPVTSIRPNPRQPRRSMDAESLAELAASIAAVGVVQPVIVRQVGDGYELIAGERRWRAVQAAGHTVVPAIVRQASDVESLELALIENVARQQLNPIDEAYALQVLLDDLGVTQEALAGRVGKSRSAIANKVRLLDLPAPTQELLAQGALSEGHGRALLGLRSRGDQVRVGRRAAEAGWSVRAVEAEVRRLNESAKSTATAPGISQGLEPSVVDALRDGMYGLFEVMPVVRLKGEGGRIEIPFRDRQELARMLGRLSRRGE